MMMFLVLIWQVKINMGKRLLNKQENLCMRIFNLPRGAGKTLRILYASEFNNAPILCRNMQDKEYKMQMAKRIGIVIPEPICISDLANKDMLHSRDVSAILVDEALLVLQELLQTKKRNLHILGCSLSDEKNGEVIRWFNEDGFEDKTGIL